MRVLVVEDDVKVAAAVQRGLEAEGFAVDVAHDGLDGLWRATELALRRAGWRPTSPWQAAYAGAVGLQSVTAIGLLERWRSRRGDVAVWPFELPTAGTRAVVAEVYPSMHPELAGHAVRDARQVAGTGPDGTRTGLLRDAAGVLTGIEHPLLGPVTLERDPTGG